MNGWAPMFCRPEVHTSGTICGRVRRGGEALGQFLLGQRAGLEKLLHQRFVGLGHHLDQRFTRRLGGVGEVRGNRTLGHLARRVSRE